MTRVKALEQQIAKLSAAELAELRDWLLEHDWEQWDQQIQNDAESGKLGAIFRKSLEDHESHKSKEI